MKFADLQFTHAGCCGTHTWAEVTHPSGIRTLVDDSDADNDTGPYMVSTWSGQTCLIAAQELPDQAAVEVRLAADARIEP